MIGCRLQSQQCSIGEPEVHWIDGDECLSCVHARAPHLVQSLRSVEAATSARDAASCSDLRILGGVKAAGVPGECWVGFFFLQMWCRRCHYSCDVYVMDFVVFFVFPIFLLFWRYKFCFVSSSCRYGAQVCSITWMLSWASRAVLGIAGTLLCIKTGVL